MHTPGTITEADVIRTAKECSDAIMKRYAVCAEALLGIADPAAFMAAVRELREWEKEHGDCLSSSCWKDFRAAIRDVTTMLPPETAS